MKKLKSIDFKALFINHGEKFGLVLIALIVVVALGKTSWSPYPGAPGDLETQAKNARQRFTSAENRWPKEKMESFKVVDFNDRSGQLFQRLDLARFEYSTPLVKPLYRKREQASEPVYLPVEYVIADAGQAILGVSHSSALPNAAVGDPGSGPASEPAAPTPAGTQFKSSNAPGTPNAGALTPAGGIAAPGQTPMRMPTAPGAHGAHSGAAGMAGTGGAPSGVTARGARYVAVRGVFPLRQQLMKYQDALKVPVADASSKFELVDFVLERQAAVSGPNPWDTKWETVSVESALEVLREADDFELDPVQTGVTDSVITMSLPYRLMEFWGDHATHPNIRDFQLKPEEMERELKLQEKLAEEYEKAQLQTEPRRRRGLSSGQNDPRQMGAQMMAMPTSSHATQNMMTNMLDSMNQVGGTGVAGGGPRMTPADLKKRLTADGRLLLFRYFDFDVQPGMAYRYRVKLKVRNPNFERPPAEIVSPELAEGEERETPWSNISMPAVVPASVNYFLKDVERDPSRDDKSRANKPVANISMFEWDTVLGTMKHDTLKIMNVGQFIWDNKKKTIVMDPAVPSYKEDVEVPFLTGDVLLDASGDFDFSPDQHPDLGLRPEKKGTPARLGLVPEAVVMTELGEMRDLNPITERANEQRLKQRVDAERKKLKNDSATQPGGAHAGAGSNPYEMMTADKTIIPGMPQPAAKKSPKKKGAAGAHGSADSAEMSPMRRSGR